MLRSVSNSSFSQRLKILMKFCMEFQIFIINCSIISFQCQKVVRKVQVVYRPWTRIPALDLCLTIYH